MRRRLLVAIVGTVAAAVLMASIVALVGIRAAELDRTTSNLVEYAQQFAKSEQSRSLQGLESVRTALGLETAFVVTYPAALDENTAQFGMTAAEFVSETGTNQQLQSGGATLKVTDRINADDLRLIAEGKPVTGILDDRVFAAVKRSQPEPAGVDSEAVSSVATTDAGAAGDAANVEALVLITAFRYNPTRTIVALGLAALAALLLASLLATVFARRLAKPLVAATAAYKRIASGDLSVRVNDRDRGSARTDEIGELMRSLDVMADSLDRAQKQEQQFLLSVSHDLRTPLTSIRGFAEAIAEGTAPDHTRAAEVIASESRRLERLVRDLLELAKLDANRFELHVRKCDLTDLVTDAADGFLPAVERVNLSLGLDADDDCVAMVDPERLGQVLANLIENAMKFARSSVHVELRRPRHNVDAFQITIRDDGPGIDDDDLPHVFNRLFMSDRRPTRQLGSGLGLAIVKELLDAMGASVQVNTSSAGTAFIVDLPEQSPATTLASRHSVS